MQLHTYVKAMGNFFFLLKSSFTNLYSYIVCTYTSFHRDICMDVVKAYSSVSEYIVDFKSSFLSSSPPRIHVIWLTLGKFFTKPKPSKKSWSSLMMLYFWDFFFELSKKLKKTCMPNLNKYKLVYSILYLSLSVLSFLSKYEKKNFLLQNALCL